MNPASSTPKRLSPTIRPDAISTPNCLADRSFARGPAVIRPSDDRAHNDRQGGRGRKIDAQPHRQRRQRRPSRVAKSSSTATIAAPISAPVPINASQSGPRSRLWPTPRSASLAAQEAAARSHVKIRRTGEAVASVEQVEDRRNHQRADGNTENQRNLLPPRRRADELAGLEILQVIV